MIILFMSWLRNLFVFTRFINTYVSKAANEQYIHNMCSGDVSLLGTLEVFHTRMFNVLLMYSSCLLVYLSNQILEGLFNVQKFFSHPHDHVYI